MLLFKATQHYWGPAHTKIFLVTPGASPQGEPTRAGATGKVKGGNAKRCHPYMVYFVHAGLLYTLNQPACISLDSRWITNKITYKLSSFVTFLLKKSYNKVKVSFNKKKFDNTCGTLVHNLDHQVQLQLTFFCYFSFQEKLYWWWILFSKRKVEIT